MCVEIMDQFIKFEIENHKFENKITVLSKTTLCTINIPRTTLTILPVVLNYNVKESTLHATDLRDFCSTCSSSFPMPTFSKRRRLASARRKSGMLKFTLPLEFSITSITYVFCRA